MNSGSFDANVLLRLLLNDIEDQHAAVLNLMRDPSASFTVADVAVVEVVFVLERHYGFTRNQIAEAIEGLCSIPQITCNQTLFQKTLPVFVKNMKLSFEDCCLATYAELQNSLPLWTFDRKLANQAPGAKIVPIK